jgi:hypothetical protein
MALQRASSRRPSVVAGSGGPILRVTRPLTHRSAEARALSDVRTAVDTSTSRSALRETRKPYSQAPPRLPGQTKPASTMVNPSGEPTCAPRAGDDVTCLRRRGKPRP